MFLWRLTSTANRSIINTNVCSLAFREGAMNYKMMIIELLEKVESEYTLKRVYRLLEYLYLKEESGD